MGKTGINLTAAAYAAMRAANATAASRGHEQLTVIGELLADGTYNVAMTHEVIETIEELKLPGETNSDAIVRLVEFYNSLRRTH